MLKIGIVCPIGNIEKHGYYHISDIILQSFCDFADRVVLISSTEDHGEINNKNSKIQLISTTETWFKDGYSMEELVDNCNVGLKILREEGYDIGILLSINQYIPAANFEAIRTYIENFMTKNKPCTYLYKMYQCATNLYNADTRLPWILNLHHTNYKIAPDSLVLTKKLLFWEHTETKRIKNGNFEKYNDIAIVDVMGELTRDESALLWLFVGDGNGYYKKKLYHDENQNYVHSHWLKHLRAKLKRRCLSSNPVDIYGRIIINRSNPEYISHELLKEDIQ